jgi:hypothetical protein
LVLSTKLSKRDFQNYLDKALIKNQKSYLVLPGFVSTSSDLALKSEMLNNSRVLSMSYSAKSKLFLLPKSYLKSQWLDVLNIILVKKQEIRVELLFFIVMKLDDTCQEPNLSPMEVSLCNGKRPFIIKMNLNEMIEQPLNIKNGELVIGAGPGIDVAVGFGNCVKKRVGKQMQIAQEEEFYDDGEAPGLGKRGSLMHVSEFLDSDAKPRKKNKKNNVLLNVLRKDGGSDDLDSIISGDCFNIQKKSKQQLELKYQPQNCPAPAMGNGQSQGMGNSIGDLRNALNGSGNKRKDGLAELENIHLDNFKPRRDKKNKKPPGGRMQQLI